MDPFIRCVHLRRLCVLMSADTGAKVLWRRDGGICDVVRDEEEMKRRKAGSIRGQGLVTALRAIQFTSDTPAVSINGIDVE